jgi:hypothetical protein
MQGFLAEHDDRFVREVELVEVMCSELKDLKKQRIMLRMESVVSHHLCGGSNIVGDGFWVSKDVFVQILCCLIR